MSGNLAIPNTFTGASGNVPASQLDADYNAIRDYVNNREVTLGTLGARPAASVAGRWYFATDTGQLFEDNGTAWTQVGAVNPPRRSYLAGLGLSTAGGSTTMTVAPGEATDSTNVDMLTLAASLGKTTAAWAVGGGNGGLDTGAIAASTWYHWWLIKRTDTGVVDALCSLSATAPTMPASYTERRRIGAGRTDGSSNWTAFTQDGDYVRWAASVRDVNTTNPGTAAVTATLGSVPPGINVRAMLNVFFGQSTAQANSMYVSDLAANDEAPTGGTGVAPGSTLGGQDGITAPFNYNTYTEVRTNTAAQIRYRMFFSDANTTVGIITLGWIDRRGRDA